VRWAPPLAFLVLVAASANAQPQDDGASAGAQLFHDAEEDERAGAYAKALGEYERAVATSPSAAFVPRAQARARVLREHTEGDFVPFAALQAIRADAAKADDPKALADLAARADGFPPGQVRSEVRLLVAEAYAGRLHRLADALPLLDEVAGDASADPLTARLSLDMLVAAELELGRLDDASAAIARHAGIAEPSLVQRVRTLVRRRAIHRAATFALVALLALVVSALGRAAARKELGAATAAIRASYKLIAGFLGYLTIAGAALAVGYEPGTGAPFLVFGAVALPLALAARAWGAIGSARPAPRAARALVCSASVVAAAFLVLEWINTEYLKGFGL
jgi:hypothetical protein